MGQESTLEVFCDDLMKDYSSYIFYLNLGSITLDRCPVMHNALHEVEVQGA